MMDKETLENTLFLALVARGSHFGRKAETLSAWAKEAAMLIEAENTPSTTEAYEAVLARVAGPDIRPWS